MGSKLKACINSVPIDAHHGHTHTLHIALTGAIVGLSPGGAAPSRAVCSTSQPPFHALGCIQLSIIVGKTSLLGMSALYSGGELVPAFC